MKIVKLIFLFLFLPSISQAASLVLSRGELINCKPSTSFLSLAKAPDGTVVSCTLSENVMTFTTNKLVFPTGSKLSGKTKGGKVLWNSLTTPDGKAVSEVQDHPDYFTTMGGGKDPHFHIVITHDLKVDR